MTLGVPFLVFQLPVNQVRTLLRLVFISLEAAFLKVF